MSAGLAIGDEVAVTLPGLSRDLYGRVAEPPRGGRVSVRLESGRGSRTVEVPTECVRPWRDRSTQGQRNEGMNR